MKTKLNGILTLFLAFVLQIGFAQTKTVSGVVTDPDGLPLPGVNVLIEGQSTGTQTGFDGDYTIQATSSDKLTFSYVGFQTQTVSVGDKTEINVQLQIGEALDEVVITGYSSQKRSDITGSVVKVESETLQNIVTPTVDQALQGNVSGLTVSSGSGTPGSTSSIRIRGISSITAGNEPLYVIDGVPVNNGNVNASGATSTFSTLSAFDSNNIESITVLKDASATAQYGARGSNGVILINTKSGKAGKTTFTVNSTYGFQNDAVDGPTPLTAANRLELASEAYFNDGFFGSEEDAEAYLLSREPYASWDTNGRPEGNWKEAVTNKDAVIQQHSFSANGGGDGHTFYASLGYMEQESTVIGSEFERINGAINFTKDLSDKIKFSSSNSVAHTLQEGFLERSAYFEGPRTAPFFLSPLRQPYNQDGELNEFGGSLPNPLIIMRDNVYEQAFTRLVTNNSITWNLAEGLNFGSTFNVDYQIYNSKNYSNRNYGYGVPTSGDASQYTRNNVFYVFQNYLDYNFSITEDHVFDAKLLQEYQSNRRYFLGGAGENFAADGLINLNNVGTPTSVNSSFNDWYVGAYLGLLSYKAFNSKYVLDLSYRREGNSRFSQDNRWGNFWSIGTAWNMNKEAFMSEVGFVDALKLRGSYGVTGNANIGLNQYQSLFSFNGDYGGQGAQSVGTFGNSDLTWETSKTLDVGLDFVLFKGALSGSFAYFDRSSEDLLLNVPLSLTTGFSSQVRNIGALNNKGFEVDLSAFIVRSADLNISLSGNISTVENEINKLPLKPNGEERTITTTTTRIESGHPVNAWYMPTWAGVNPETGLEEYYVNGVDGETTTNFNEAEAVFQGDNAVPTITAGLNFHIDYKGFFLDVQGYYAGGHKIYEGWHRYTNTTNGFPIFAFQGLTSLLDRWQEPGDISRNGKFTSSFTPWQRHSKYLYEADFLRLRSVNFGYDFKSKFKDIGIDGLRLFVRGNNLATWVKDDNLAYDPEQDLGGETGLETPPIKSVSFGLTLKF
ncbi:SusC/RagA family TonB-linked outer membrane protein [Psychroflexus sp. CAK1W]|uniref:SusC/RagA family TonB-linked outer membrane protein n=1 Tax=Psychroflexus curvus TaxID=2873595 RepID=UPI001CCEC419|nr:SusC/RagA family TonB-linked outer membrane protein [Psychroflexus curvus]MBZ9628241.1 SusC/RagA family TonB-linked outer membrane protein [Psychroflexus curvus]